MVEQIEIKIEVEEYVEEIEIDLQEAIILGANILKESQTKNQNITANGYYEITPDDGCVLEKVNVNVDVPIPEGYLKPEGTIEITSNGEVDVKNYEKAKVNVPQEIDAFLQAELVEYYNDRVTKVAYAFANNYTIKKVELSNVIEVGDRAFSGCANLETAICPKVKKLGSYSFYGTKITSDNTLFQTVDTFEGTNQFYSCGQLTKVVMPLVTQLPTACFAACNRISILYFPNITSIGSNCFQNCYSMTALVLPQDRVVSLLNARVFDGIHRIVGTQNNVYNPDGGINCFFYVNDNRLEEYKNATNWSSLVNNLKPISELPQEIRVELGL